MRHFSLLLVVGCFFHLPAFAARPTTVTMLGSAVASPAAGEDTACFLINGTLLVDCGFNAANNMKRYGHDPIAVEMLYLTHCHHDHYMGLPALMFLRGMRQKELENKPPLRVIGPPDDMPVVVDLSRKFLQADRFPVVWPKVELQPLEPGKTYEDDAFHIETIKSIHGVTGVCSRLTDKATGAVIAFSGDTAPNAEFAKLARGADLMIHEASLGPTVPDDRVGQEHSRSIDAARTAREAGVKRLLLIHLSQRQRDASLVAARAIFANTDLAVEGDTIELPGATGPGDVKVIRSEFVYQTAPFAQCHASTIAETKEGLVAAWFGGTREGNADVGIWSSRHDGKAWSAPVELANGLTGDGDSAKRYPCWNPVLYRLKDGPLVLFYKVGPSPSAWWGMRMISNDSGKTWSKPVRLGGENLGPIKNKPAQLPDGSLLCPSSTEHRGWRVHMEKTGNLGDSAEVAAPPPGKVGAIQPTILTWPGGRLQILCRAQSGGNILESWSSDGGKSWSELRPTDLPNPNSGIDAVSLRDGRALLVYNNTPRGRSPLNVAMSAGGKTWTAGPTLESDPGEYSYPAVIQTTDGLVHITYTWKRMRIRHVVLSLEGGRTAD